MSAKLTGPDWRVGSRDNFTGGPYEVIRDVINCKNCAFAYLQGSGLLYPVVQNVLTIGVRECIYLGMPKFDLVFFK